MSEEKGTESFQPQEDTSPFTDLGVNMFSSLPEAGGTSGVMTEPEPLNKRMKQQDKPEDKMSSSSTSFEMDLGKQRTGAQDGSQTSSDHKQSPNQVLKSINDVLKELGQESKDLHSAWSQSFSDGERFEQFCPTRLDRLIEEATTLEQNIQKQKEQLTKRLHGISKVLEM